MISNSTMESSVDIEYKPKKRCGHSSVQIGEKLYIWAGETNEPFRSDHDSFEKRSFASFVEIFDLRTGKWEQKHTIGDPPLSINSFASAAVGKDIFYFGGYCGHGNCLYNNIYSLNVDTLTWKKHNPVNPQDGPTRKCRSSMMAAEFAGEDFLIIVGGYCYNKHPHNNQEVVHPGIIDEIHYYQVSEGKWITPTVSGERPPPCDSLTLSALNNDSALLFGGSVGIDSSNSIYFGRFTKTQATWKRLLNEPSHLVEQPKGRHSHSSVIVKSGSGPHLFTVGGASRINVIDDCWIFDLNNDVWVKASGLPDTVTKRCCHTLSVWYINKTTAWIIEYGGNKNQGKPSAMADEATMIIRLGNLDSPTNSWSIDSFPLSLYAERLKEELHPYKTLHEKYEKRQILRQMIDDKERELKDLKEQYQQNEDGIEGLLKDIKEDDLHSIFKSVGIF